MVQLVGTFMPIYKGVNKMAKSLKRRIAEYKAKQRQRSEKSLATENRKLSLQRNKQKRTTALSSTPAGKARAERQARQQASIKKAEGQIWAGLKSLGKAVEKHVSGSPKRTRKPVRKAVKKSTKRGGKR
jgi:hypothetical protein